MVLQSLCHHFIWSDKFYYFIHIFDIRKSSKKLFWPHLKRLNVLLGNNACIFYDITTIRFYFCTQQKKTYTQIIFMCILYSVNPLWPLPTAKCRFTDMAFRSNVYSVVIWISVYSLKKAQTSIIHPYTDNMSVAADRAEILIGRGDLIFISRSFQQAISQRLEKHFTK